MPTFYKGNALDIVKTLPDESVNCIVTSPPYYALRKYLGAQDVTWPDGWFGALGCEPNPEMYVDHLCAILTECHRVLRKDGTLWLNLGSSYAVKDAESDEWELKDNIPASTVLYILKEMGYCD